jgi:hypothetical protein
VWVRPSEAPKRVGVLACDISHHADIMHTRTKVMRDSAMFCTSVATKLVYSYKKTLVVVSHDRGFLNEVTTDIIHLHDEALHYYKGNHASFEDMYEQRRRAANKEFEKFTKNMKNAAVCAHAPALMLWRCRLFTRADCGASVTLQTQCLFHGSCLTHCNICGSELTSGAFAMHSISYRAIKPNVRAPYTPEDMIKASPSKATHTP